MTFLIIFTIIVLIVLLIGIFLSVDYCVSITGIFMSIIGLLGSIILMVMWWNYIAAGYKLEVINNAYGTDYTQDQIYYASDVIEVVRELQRKRVEINGNLITGEDK